MFQLKSRKESCETKATASRNEFLLCMAAANAHHVRYFNKDLPSLIEVSMLTVMILCFPTDMSGQTVYRPASFPGFSSIFTTYLVL